MPQKINRCISDVPPGSILIILWANLGCCDARCCLKLFKNHFKGQRVTRPNQGQRVTRPNQGQRVTRPTQGFGNVSRAFRQMIVFECHKVSAYTKQLLVFTNFETISKSPYRQTDVDRWSKCTMTKGYACNEVPPKGCQNP